MTPLFIQWENENTGTAFPFRDDTLPEDFPRDVVMDACVSSPVDEVYLDSLHVGPRLASIVVSASGAPVLQAHVLVGEYTPFSPVALSSLVPGYSGIVTFGDLSSCWRGTYVPKDKGVRFSETAVMTYPEGGLKSLFLSEYGLTATGTIGFDLPSGITAVIREDDASGETIVSFSATEELKDRFANPCTTSKDSITMPVPIRRINGISPDDKGRIMLFFTGGGLASRLDKADDSSNK